MKWSEPKIDIETGMERLAKFIKNYHGAQDWEKTVYNLQDYLAAFIGTRGKGVYQDLMGRMKGRQERGKER
jgi:hypothetical protein